MEITREKFEALKAGLFFKGVIVSDSMGPLIKIGDTITVQVGVIDLNRFDVLVVFLDGKLVCHYLWAMNKVFHPILLQTRNLKYGSRDLPVSFDDYLGKVVSHKLSWFHKTRIILRSVFSGR